MLLGIFFDEIRVKLPSVNSDPFCPDCFVLFSNFYTETFKKNTVSYL